MTPSQINDRPKVAVTTIVTGFLLPELLLNLTLLENMRLATDLATDFHQNRLLIQLATDLATN
jgi:hypothetical protein